MKITVTRRNLLKAAAGGLGAAALPGSALAYASSDYRAIVAVMMRGGLDSQDCLIPTDPTGYASWAKARAALLAPGAPNRDRSALLPLEGLGQSFGLAPELEALMPLYREGRLAIVPNIGPLEETTSRRGVRDKTALIPPRIASHNDQQSVWEGLEAEGARWGWGGRLIDAVAPLDRFGAVSIQRNTLFTAGKSSRPVVVGTGAIKTPFGQEHKFGSREIPTILAEHFASAGGGRSNLLMQDLAAFQRRAIEDYTLLGALLSDHPIRNAVEIPGNGLSVELAQVAALIANRDALGAKRQVFFVQAHGTFDTHSRQMSLLPQGQLQVATALASFQSALDELGVASNVTTFTMSDFGRTLVSNPSGTDHGWGGHSFVLGGAVNGGRAVAPLPPSEVEHDQDFRRGALIPTLAIEQMGAELGRFLGVAETDLDEIFPKLNRFDRHGVSLF
jgi:uncharacterized protein (DUF1501 family)